MPGSDMRIVTEQFLLRPMERADITERCCRWFEDGSSNRYFDPEGRVDRTMLESWIEHAERTPSSYLVAICDRETDLPIGMIRTHVSGDTATSSLMVGETSYWGRNVAVEAHSAWRRFLNAQRLVRSFRFRVSRRNRFMLQKLSKLPGIQRGEQRGSWVIFTVDGGYDREL